MRKTLLSITLFLFAAVAAYAQAPQIFNYQGVARNLSGAPLANQTISLRLTIHDVSAAGTILYQESHSVTTNPYGLYNVSVGTGTNTTGTFSTINWGSNPKYMQVEVDPAGGTSYGTLGSTQLASVPYAVYSNFAGTATNATNLIGTVPMAGDVTGTNAAATVVKLQGNNISTTAPTSGQILAWNSSTNSWEPSSTGSGSVTNVTAGSGLTSVPNPITTSGTISMPNLGTPGTYGSGTQVPVIQTDAQGRVISVINTPIISGAGTVTSITAGPGLTETPNPITTAGTIDLPAVGTVGTYGSATQVPVFTTDAYGRVTGVVNTPITTSSASGTTNYISKFTAPTTLGNSQVYDDGNSVGVATTTPAAKFDVEGSADITAIIGGLAFDHQALIGATGTTSTINLSDGVVAYADNSSFENHGITGVAEDASGIANSVGVFGFADPLFTSGNSYGTFGRAVDGSTNYGIYGDVDLGPGFAGYFDGDVTITGTMTAGTKAFKIDDPLDPANKYLYHSCVESPDMMNIYNGNVTTDASGVAVVTLPDYFEALNKDFRYQLTVIGTFAQAIISKEISGNQFELKTSVPNVKVSWQVTGVRNDPAANAHRVVPVVEKEAKLKGYYLDAKAWGQPSSKSMHAVTAPKGIPAAKKGAKSTNRGTTK